VKYGLKAAIGISCINILVQTGSRAGGTGEGGSPHRTPQRQTDGQESRAGGGQWRKINVREEEKGMLLGWGGSGNRPSDPRFSRERLLFVPYHWRSAESPERWGKLRL
jgi:hypothetical protein